MERLSVRVYGQVQGVSFRAFVARRAGGLGIAGYARNMPDGTVQVVAEGERSKLDRLLEQLHVGPESARVDRVEVHRSPARGDLSDFKVL